MGKGGKAIVQDNLELDVLNWDELMPILDQLKFDKAGLGFNDTAVGREIEFEIIEGLK